MLVSQDHITRTLPTSLISGLAIECKALFPDLHRTDLHVEQVFMQSRTLSKGKLS